MQKTKSYRNLILCCCIAGIAMLLAFFFLYQTYIRDIIYEERLNQMEEITHQMFQNLEDVIDSHWDRVTEECNSDDMPASGSFPFADRCKSHDQKHKNVKE